MPRPAARDGSPLRWGRTLLLSAAWGVGAGGFGGGHGLVVLLLGDFLFVDQLLVAGEIVLRLDVVGIRLHRLRLRVGLHLFEAGCFLCIHVILKDDIGNTLRWVLNHRQNLAVVQAELSTDSQCDCIRVFDCGQVYAHFIDSLVACQEMTVAVIDFPTVGIKGL